MNTRMPRPESMSSSEEEMRLKQKPEEDGLARDLRRPQMRIKKMPQRESMRRPQMIMKMPMPESMHITETMTRMPQLESMLRPKITP